MRALEGELRDSRARILEAGHAERRRIERNLHDSAQQRLLALRVHLTLVEEQLARSQDRVLLQRLGDEVDETIEALRDVAQGVYPQLLSYAGLGEALRAVSNRSAISTSVRDTGLSRHSEALETAVYFCCVECLQNAAKHAGPGASVAIRLSQDDGHTTFVVEDDGWASTSAPWTGVRACRTSRTGPPVSAARSKSRRALAVEPA